jgi:hypothetical protein
VVSAPDPSQRLIDALISAVREVEYYLSNLPGLGGLLIVVAIALGVVVALNVIWSLRHAVMGEPPREGVRLIASRLADALRARAETTPVLEGMRGILEGVLPERLAAAARELRSGMRPTLVSALVANRILPRALASIAVGAERLGPQVLEGWLRSLARDQNLSGSWQRRLAPTLLTAIGMAGMVVFLGIFIAPKWRAIAGDLGVAAPGMARIAEFADNVWLIGLVIAALGVLIVSCCARWRWRRERLLLRGEAILQAVQSGVAEGDIAAALGLTGADGSLPALCRSAGWAVDDADALALALERTRRRRERAAAVAMSVAEVALPLLLALPVLAIGRSVFGALVALMQSIGESL